MCKNCYHFSLKYQFGVGFIYGPQYISDSYFIGFNSAADDSFLSGALSFKPKAEFPPSILSAVYNLKFGFDDSVCICFTVINDTSIFILSVYLKHDGVALLGMAYRKEK